MKLDSLKPLLHHDGPLTTVCFDATRGEEAGSRDLRSRWNGLRQTLEQAGAPERTLGVLEEVVLRPTHVRGTHGRYVVVGGTEVLYDRVLAEPPVRDEAFHDGAPSLVPAVAAADESVHYLLVEVDRQGADLTWSSGDGRPAPAERDQVEGGHDVLHKFGGGAWSHRRFQMRVEDSWERNAEAVAQELDRCVTEHRPEVVLLTGDVRAVALVRERVGRHTADLITEVPGGSRADGVNVEAFRARLDEVLEAHRERRREAVVARLREGLGRGDGAVTALGDVVDVLRKGQVDELVVLRDDAGASVARLNEKSLWVGPEPLQLGLSRSEVAALGVPEDQARRLRADVAVLRAALAQDAGFTFALEGSVDLLDGIGAILRWSDAATPHEAAPAYTRNVHRRRQAGSGRR